MALVAVMLAARSGAVTVSSLNKIEAIRSQAMGGAASALGGDASLAWLNPAAPGGEKSASLTLAGQRGFADDLIGQGLGVLPLKVGVVFVGVSGYTYGSVTLNSTDGSSREVSGQQDMLGAVGFSREVTPGISAGACAKIMRSSLLGEMATSAMSFDVGIQAGVIPMVKAGLSLRNLGTKMKYYSDPVNTPFTVRTGVAVESRFGEVWGKEEALHTITTVADVEYPPEEKRAILLGGVEYRWKGMIAVRAGIKYGFREELNNYSAGLGFILGKHRLDYSVKLGSLVYDVPQAVSLTIGF